MRKRKLYFGTRRQWPDSPYRQIVQAKWDLTEIQQNTPIDYELFHNLQSLEFDIMIGLTKMVNPMTEHIVGSHRSNMRRGEFYTTTAGYNPNPHMMSTHRLKAMLDKGLQGNLMICLEDSYSLHHDKSNHDFENLAVETPNDYVRPSIW